LRDKQEAFAVSSAMFLTFAEVFANALKTFYKKALAF